MPCKDGAASAAASACPRTNNRMAAMADQAMKRRRGRPRSTDAKTGAERQQLYAKARARDMAEVAYALKDALAAKGTQKAFITAYRGPLRGATAARPRPPAGR